MIDDPNSTEYGEWGVYELSCDDCGTKIVVVALVDQWERGETEVQEIIARDGATRCRVCTHLHDNVTAN